MPRRPKGDPIEGARHQVAPELLPLLEPVDRVLFYPGNARTHALPVITESLVLNGQYKALTVQTSTGFVLAGNGTLEAVLQLGWTHVAVEWLDVDDDRARRIVLVDNAASDAAGYEQRALVDLLELAAASELGLAGTGHTEHGMAELVAALGRAGSSDRDDAPPKPTVPPIPRLGQTWLLGEHRLVVGDATDGEAVIAACEDQDVDLLLTDPPYGVSYVGNAGTIENDDLRGLELQALLAGALTAAASVMRPGCPFYVFAPSGFEQLAFRLALVDAGLTLHQQIVWVKNALVLGRSDYQPRHEAILAGDLPDPEPVGLVHDDLLYGWTEGRHMWRGGRKQTSVWHYPKPPRSDLHPTMKPVAMLEQAITNSSPAGGLVLDSFAGSGSTLIACHATNRRAALIEIDPAYAHVICRRWQTHTGILPVRVGTKRGVDFTKGA